MKLVILILLIYNVVLINTIVLVKSRKNPSTTLLNQWPMVAAHDAATSYLSSNVINKWAKTQPEGGIRKMLECGARFFDWRPKLLKNGELVMHHSAIVVNYPMSKVLDELILWLSDNKAAPLENNLVVLGITDCDGGDKCIDAVENELKLHNITFIKNCTLVHNMTVAAATKLSPLPVISVNSCWDENYDPTIACSGFHYSKSSNITNEKSLSKSSLLHLQSPDHIEYTCYNNSATKLFPLNRIYNYINKTLSQMAYRTNKTLFTVQAIWQETVGSVIVSGQHDSSLLLDESKSQINHILAEKIMNKEFDVTNVNAVEINNVCDGGIELLNALREKSS